MKAVNVDEVLKIIHKYGEYVFVTDYKIYTEMQDEIANLKAIEPESKTGRWIDNKCSVCGKGIEDLIDSREWYRNEKPNFCPFCGLKLVDSQESEEAQPKQTDEEIKPVIIDLGDEVVNEWGTKGVVVGIETSYEGEVLLSLLMRNYKVPQLVQASRYKTKTGRYFPQIIEVFDKIYEEAESEEEE